MRTDQLVATGINGATGLPAIIAEAPIAAQSTLAVQGAITAASTLAVAGALTAGSIDAPVNVVVEVSGARTLDGDSPTGTWYVAAETDGDAATEFTLPAPAAATKGKAFYFVQRDDQNMTITCPTANKVLLLNNKTTAEGMVFSSSGEKIGAVAYAICDGTYWIVLALRGTGTAVTG